MIYLLFFPFILQAILIFSDELFFHIKRGLPRFERLGHPLDTLTVLACFGFAMWVPYSPFFLKCFIALGAFSAIFVTKDEFVHKDLCPWKEHWLHACLFLNHPLLLGSLIILWMGMYGQFEFLLIQTKFIKLFITMQSLLVFLFFLYQIIYWNFIYEEKRSDQ